MLYRTTRSTQIIVGPKSVLTLYCVPKVLFLTSIVILVSRGNGWSYINCPLFGGFTGLECNIGCQILGGSAPPPNLNIQGGGGLEPPQPPQLLRPCYTAGADLEFSRVGGGVIFVVVLVN